MTSETNLYLAPTPKKLMHQDGVFDTKTKRYIKLETKEPQSLMAAAKKAGLGWEITASPKAPKERIGLVIRIDNSSKIPDQGYKLNISPKLIEIIAPTPAGAFYGACTLAQIVRQSDGELPCLSISDRPDFPARGIMLDISRDKVPTMDTLYCLVDLMADWKLNQLQLYTEHTFAYLAHPVVWKNASPMTGEEILTLEAYCKERFIELVPNQNSFGHMTRWLIHDEYRGLAEAPNGCDTIWGYFKDPFSLCPLDKRNVPLLKGIYDELLPHFTSRLFNVGCDETVDLGCGRSKTACEEHGTGRVYLDFLLEIYKLVNAHGRTMMFWGDIIMHHPELIPELPKEIIALEWGYEANHPFLEHGAKFAESGIPFYVCPGTSSWNTLSGRTEEAIQNITNAAINGLKNGSIGLLNTDWGDNGHWQPLSVSYLGFIVGAMASWNARADVRKGLTENLSVHAFGDRTGKSGRAFYDLGDLYQVFERKAFNSSIPWHMLFDKLDDPASVDGLKPEEFDAMEQKLKEIKDSLKGESMTFTDAAIVREELQHLFEILELAAQVGKMRLGGSKIKELSAKVEQIKKNHEHVWLLRNRIGGLADSVVKIVG